jgi:hypothetical protein
MLPYLSLCEPNPPLDCQVLEYEEGQAFASGDPNIAKNLNSGNIVHLAQWLGRGLPIEDKSFKPYSRFLVIYRYWSPKHHRLAQLKGGKSKHKHVNSHSDTNKTWKRLHHLRGLAEKGIWLGDSARTFNRFKPPRFSRTGRTFHRKPSFSTQKVTFSIVQANCSHEISARRHPFFRRWPCASSLN